MNNVSAVSPGVVADAGRRLREGGLVAFPTETVYGLGANALDVTAVARIFEAKQRPHFDPLIVHLASVDVLSSVVSDISPVVRELAAAFWPGPLTLVLPKAADVPSLVTSGLSTVAVRVPSHPVAQQILSAAGVPVAAPSANPFGKLSPVNARHVLDGLGDAVDLIVDGGATAFGLESTIIDPSDPEHVRVLRQGAVSEEELEQVLGSRLVRQSRHEVNEARPTGPGQLEQHYSPHTRLVCTDRGRMPSPLPDGCAYLAFSQQTDSRNPEAEATVVRVLSENGDVREAATKLFDVLHELDAMDVEVIYAELAPNEGVGRAINDRLLRAAAAWK